MHLNSMSSCIVCDILYILFMYSASNKVLHSVIGRLFSLLLVVQKMH